MKRTILAGLVVLLALAGCTAAPHEPAAEEVAETVGYPVGWPTTDVPMLDGTLLHFAHPGNLWAGWVEADDLVADLATASTLLVDAGYTITVQADGYFEFTNPDRAGRVVAAVDATWGSCLLYTFTDGAIEAEATESEADTPAGEH